MNLIFTSPPFLLNRKKKHGQPHRREVPRVDCGPGGPAGRAADARRVARAGDRQRLGAGQRRKASTRTTENRRVRLARSHRVQTDIALATGSLTKFYDIVECLESVMK